MLLIVGSRLLPSLMLRVFGHVIHTVDLVVVVIIVVIILVSLVIVLVLMHVVIVLVIIVVGEVIRKLVVHDR